MRFDSSFDGGVVRSESATDLNLELVSGSGTRERSRPSTSPGFNKVGGDSEHITSPPKPFGLGECYQLFISYFYLPLYVKAHGFAHPFSSWILMHTFLEIYN